MRRWFPLAAVLFLACSPDAPLKSVTADLEIDVSELEFETILLHHQRTLPITVRSVSSRAARLVWEVQGDAFSATSGEATIPPGGTAQVDAHFVPREPGVHEGALWLSLEGSESEPLRVLLRGEGTTRALSAVERVSFGAVEEYTSKVISVEVRNSTKVAVDVAISMRGANPTTFRPQRERLPIPAEGRSLLAVEFAPTLHGPYAAELELRPCEQCEGIFVRLDGEALLPPFRAAPDVLDFGELLVGEATTLVGTLELTGRKHLQIYEADAGGPPFELVDGPALPLGKSVGSVDFPVEFRPLEPGDHEAELAIDTSEGMVRIPIRGEAVPPPLLPTPLLLDFGDEVIRGTPAEKTLLVQAQGGAQTLDSVAVIGPGASAYEVFPQARLPATVFEAAPIAVTVRQVATQTGIWDAQVMVRSGDYRAYVTLHAQVVPAP